MIKNTEHEHFVAGPLNSHAVQRGIGLKNKQAFSTVNRGLRNGHINSKKQCTSELTNTKVPERPWKTSKVDDEIILSTVKNPFITHIRMEEVACRRQAHYCQIPQLIDALMNINTKCLCPGANH